MQQLYDAWTTRAELEKWFLRKAEFIMPGGAVRPAAEHVLRGDRYEWMWHGYPDSVLEHGEVTEANGRDRFQFVFGAAGLVTVKLYPLEKLNIVEVLQENIATDDVSKVNWHIGCMTGWLFYLVNLKSIYEGGADLRNKDVRIQEVVNA
jgi:hypothetical protein